MCACKFICIHVFSVSNNFFAIFLRTFDFHLNETSIKKLFRFKKTASEYGDSARICRTGKYVHKTYMIRYNIDTQLCVCAC